MDLNDNGYDVRGTRKKMKGWKKALIIITAVILVAIIAVLGIAIHMFRGLKMNKLSENKEELGISPEAAEQYEGAEIRAIAMFGLDGRDQSSINGRSDSIMLLVINTKLNKVKLVSILRDSYVAIEGHDKQKLGHAYAHGGAQLAVKTLNQNFHLNISDYVTTNFEGMTNIIDSIGGVDVEITEKESGSIPDATGAGVLHMNGKQALAYSRIRMIDTDNRRADRQKTVLKAMLKQVKTNVSPTQYVGLAKDAMSHVETSLSYGEMVSFANMLAKINDSVKEMNVPDLKEDDPWGGILSNAVGWVWTYNLDAAGDRINKFILEDW